MPRWPPPCPTCNADTLVGLLCADCGAHVPQRWQDGVAVHCDWEMVRLPAPRDGVGACFHCQAILEDVGAPPP
jgi:hypothetical protein